MNVKINPEKVIKVKPITVREGGKFGMPFNEAILILCMCIVVYSVAVGEVVTLANILEAIFFATYFIVNAINKLRNDR